MNGNVFYFGWEVSLMEWIQSWIGTVGAAIAQAFRLCDRVFKCGGASGQAANK